MRTYQSLFRRVWDGVDDCEPTSCNTFDLDSFEEKDWIFGKKHKPKNRIGGNADVLRSSPTRLFIIKEIITSD